MKLRRLIILLCASAAITALFLIFIALLLPRFVDGQLLRAKIASQWEQKTKGSLTLGKIELQWLPRPMVVIENAALTFDETRGAIRAVKLYPSLAQLLRGRVVVYRAQLQQPRVVIRLPAGEPLPRVEDLEKAIGATLTFFTTELSGLSIDLTEGSAEITIGHNSTVNLENIDAQTVVSAKEMVFQLSARSNLCAGLQLEGRIFSESLASRFAVALQRVKLKESLQALPFQLAEYAQQGEGNFDLKITSRGLRKINALLDGSIVALVLARRGGTVKVEAKKLKGSVVYDDGAIQAGIEELNLASPRLYASGELKSAPDSSSARLQIRDLNVGEIRDAALRVADDFAGVNTLFRFLRAGAISEMVVQSGGRSFAELGLIKNISISGFMRNGWITLSEPNLDLTNVNGFARVSGGMLEAKELAAKLGATSAWDGNLRLGLGGKSAPFHLDIALKTSAAELHTMLLKLVDHEPLRGELLKLRDVEGELAGRVVLGDKLDAITPMVAISQMAMRANYERVPFPVAIKGGRLNYEKNRLSVENVQGTAGRSTWTALTGTLSHDASRHMKINFGRLGLDLEELQALLQSFKAAPTELRKLQSARGQIELENLTLAGAYNDPARWKFSSAGTVRQVAINHAELPGSFSLRRGKFTVSEERVAFSDAAMDLLDATVIAAGVLENTKGILRLEAGGTGTIGAKAGQWLGRRVEWPKELTPRYPLKIAAERFDWQGSGDISFRGQATTAGGVAVFLNAARSPERLAVRDFAVTDGARRAHMTFQLSKENSVDMSFKGALSGDTLGKIFASSPVQAGSLQGDIQVSALLTQPVRFSARGELAGSNLSLPLERERALLEKFQIEANAGNLLVRGAELRLGNSRLTVSGKVAGDNEALRLDLDAYGERIDWEDLKPLLNRGADQREDKPSTLRFLPPLQGTVRVKADSFILEGFDFNPLRMTAGLSSSGIRAEIAQAVACGIDATGLIDVVNKEIALDIRLMASQAQLELATVCLTNQQNQLKGIFSLSARLAGRGAPGHRMPALRGQFVFSTRDGEFVRSPGIDATFDYLNATGDFNVVFPDLDKESFPYRLLSVKGTLNGSILKANEVVIQGTSLTVTGEGTVDLERNEIDAKGLVSVAAPGSRVLKKVPILGSVLGGTLLGIPVRVNGSLDGPYVSYLSPRDVGEELLSMPGRILGLPLEALEIFTPGSDAPK